MPQFGDTTPGLLEALAVKENETRSDDIEAVVVDVTPDFANFTTVTAFDRGANFDVNAPDTNPNDSAGRVIRFRDDGTPRLINWNAIYRAIGITLPTTTTANKLLYVGMFRNEVDGKYDVTSVGEEA